MTKDAPPLHDVGTTFIARDASLRLGAAFARSPERRIHMGLALDEGEDVRLPDERTLKNAEWLLDVAELTEYNEWVTEQHGIGVISTNSEGSALPSECYISVALPPAKFSSLLELVQGGRLPARVIVRAVGMGLGFDPDGAEKVWDIQNIPAAIVTEIAFDILLSDLQRVVASADPAAEQSRGDHLKEQQRLSKGRWRTLFALLVMVIVLLWFGR